MLSWEGTTCSISIVQPVLTVPFYAGCPVNPPQGTDWSPLGAPPADGRDLLEVGGATKMPDRPYLRPGGELFSRGLRFPACCADSLAVDRDAPSGLEAPLGLTWPEFISALAMDRRVLVLSAEDRRHGRESVLAVRLRGAALLDAAARHRALRATREGMAPEARLPDFERTDRRRTGATATPLTPEGMTIHEVGLLANSNWRYGLCPDGETLASSPQIALSTEYIVSPSRGVRFGHPTACAKGHRERAWTEVAVVLRRVPKSLRKALPDDHGVKVYWLGGLPAGLRAGLVSTVVPGHADVEAGRATLEVALQALLRRESERSGPNISFQLVALHFGQPPIPPKPQLMGSPLAATTAPATTAPSGADLHPKNTSPRTKTPPRQPTAKLRRRSPSPPISPGHLRPDLPQDLGWWSHE